MIDGTYTGVVDRVEDGHTAVILIEEDGEVIEQLDVHADRLSIDERTEGTVLEVTVDGGEFVEASARSDRTDERRRRLQDRLDGLSKRLGDRDE